MLWNSKKAAFIAGSLAATYLVVALGTYAYAHAWLLPKEDDERARFAQLEPRLKTDLELLSTHPVYEELPRTKNAERFLSGFIEWTGYEVPKTIEHDRLVEVMRRHEVFAKTEESWTSLLDDEALEDLDLSWVDQLVAYDYFDLQTHPSFTDMLERIPKLHGIQRIETISTLSYPNFVELRFAAAARAAQLELEGRGPEAIKLFHHVGYLVWTSDSMIGSMTSVSMLTQEKKLAEYSDAEWPGVDDSRILALKRIAWAWSGIFRLAENFDTYAPMIDRRTGACGGLTNEASVELMVTDYLRPRWFGESDHSGWLDEQERRLTLVNEKCNHSKMKAIFAPIQSPKMIGHVAPNPAHIPFLRRLIALTLVSIARPNYFRFYEDNPREPASK